MSGERTRRLTRIIAWLLTPVVAWAASFLGGWLGALVGRRAAGPGEGLAWLGAGAVVGALMGVIGWVVLLRWRMRSGETRQAPGSGKAAP